MCKTPQQWEKESFYDPQRERKPTGKKARNLLSSDKIFPTAYTFTKSTETSQNKSGQDERLIITGG